MHFDFKFLSEYKIKILNQKFICYNAPQRNRTEPKIKKKLWKNQMGFRRNRSTTSQIWTIGRILEDVRAKFP